MPLFTCGELGHFSEDYLDRAERHGKKANVKTFTASKVERLSMAIYLLFSQFFNRLVGGLIWVLMFT